MQLVDIHQVSRSYGHVQALTNVSLSLEPGTIGLVGNNGAGKSTLLKILLGLLKPDSGEGTILGCDIRRSSRLLRGRVGYLPETAATVPLLKGVEFVALSGDLYGMPHRDAKRRAHEVLNYVGLGELRYRRLEEYSTGNLQRLKLAAALVHDPQLLLLDEPTNGLDPAGRHGMLRLLRGPDQRDRQERHPLHALAGRCGAAVSAGRRACTRARSYAAERWRSCEPTATTSMSLAGWAKTVLSWMVCKLAGVQVSRMPAQGKAIVATPASWTTGQFFEVARARGVVLTQMKPEEEDLQRVFLRVTEEEKESSSPTGNAHGNR